MKGIRSLLGILPFLMFFHSSFAQDWANLKKFYVSDSILKSNPIQEDRVVFMGNSITAHWIEKSPDFWKENAYVNRGISGQTTPQMLIRFQQDVVHLHPAVVVILAGTNDLAGNTGPSTLQMIEDNLMSMAVIARANNIKVILCSLLPAYDFPWRKGMYPAKKIVNLNRWIRDYCVQEEFTYLNYYPLLVDHRGGMKTIYSKDGVHPNVAGYKVMEFLVVETINDVLKDKK